MTSTFLLIAAADPMVSGAAILAALCGIVLMGGKSVIGLPLRALQSLKMRVIRSESSVRLQMLPVQANMEAQDAPRRVA